MMHGAIVRVLWEST